MRIASLWAKGFRSLRQVRLDNLGAVNIFHGPNGAGKSNILEAIGVLIKLSATAMLQAPTLVQRPSYRAQCAIEQGIVERADLSAHDASRVMVLGARFTEAAESPPILRAAPLDLPDLTLEVTLDWASEREPKLTISTLRAGDQDILGQLDVPFLSPRASAEERAEQQRRAQLSSQLSRLLVSALPSRAYGLIRADRSLGPEKATSPPEGEDVISFHLNHGHLKSALLAAQIDPRHEVRRRLNALRSLLAGPPLHRQPFDPVQDPRSGAVDLREFLPEPNPDGRDISVERAGSGVARLYLILAPAVLLGARAIGIEEPEAHLHPATNGQKLRQLLLRLVEDKLIDQLFISTHSSLFALDPTGYFDVQLDSDGCTVVRRAPIHASA